MTVNRSSGSKKTPAPTPQSRRSARQQRIASREASRALARAGTRGSSGGNKNMLIATLAVILVAAVVVGFAWFVSRPAGFSQNPIAPGEKQVTPTGLHVDGRTLGNADAPVTVHLWEDFRCSACAGFYLDVEPKLVTDFIESGKIKLVYHDFLRIDLNDGATASRDAANAARCAADEGQFWKYHDWLFANQDPMEDPKAFSLDRLILIAKSAGIDSGTFESCVRDGAHNQDVIAESSSQSQSMSTPTVYVNDTKLASSSYADVAAAINTALGIAPSASPSVSSSASISASASGSVAPSASVSASAS
jgi:protein-disulfide isomerase